MSLAWFGLGPGASEAELKGEFRRRASQAHPDKGGSDLAFQELQARYSAAQAELDRRDAGHYRGGAELEDELQLQPDPCPECQGTGRVALQHGFSTLRWPCSACGGTGVAR